jgi:hypothetical protein
LFPHAKELVTAAVNAVAASDVSAVTSLLTVSMEADSVRVEVMRKGELDDQRTAR